MKHRLTSLVLILLLLFSGLPASVSLFASPPVGTSSFLPFSHKAVSDQRVLWTKKISFQWSEQDTEWTISDKGIAPQINGLSMRYIPGQPVVPYKVYHLKLPSRQDLVYVRTISLASSKLPNQNYPVQIAEKPLIFSNESLPSPYFLKTEIFSTDQCFPEENFELHLVSEQGQKSIILHVYPLYTFKNQWHLTQQITLELGLTQVSEPSFSAGAQDNQAVILCPDELKSSAEELKRLQESDGYKTRVITLSEARRYEPAEPPTMRGIFGFNDYPASQRPYILKYDLDTALRIRSMLRTLLKEGQVHYLTILGDASYIPPSYYVAVEDGLGPFEMWLPTDYFYMAPEASGDSYSFDINIGRLPVQSPEDAARVVDKLRRYRKVLHSDWFKKASLMGGDPFDRDYFGELVINDAINKDYFKGMEVQRLFRTEGLYSTDAVLNSFREGKHGFIWALGHGTGDGLALEPGRVDAKDIMDLPKNDYLPVVVSESCVNGAFDSRLVGTAYRSSHHFKHPMSFSEAVMMSEGAGIAYIGGVRINFGGWIKEYQRGVLDIKYLYYTNGMVAHFFEAYAKEPSTLGKLAKNAMLQYMKEDWMLYFTHVKTFFGFTFQGDPTLRLPYMANDGKKSQPAPLLSYRQEMPLSYDNIPFFSMDEGVQVDVRSNSNRLSYIVADYLDQENPLRAKGEAKRVSASQHQHFFKPDRKSFMTIRVQSEDFKETRIVFYARYNHDLVVYPEEDLNLLNLNESKDYTFRVANEGLFPARNVVVTVSSPESKLMESIIETLPPHSSHQMYFSYQATDIGDYDIQMSAHPLESETETRDNTALYPIRVSEDPIARVGVLQASEKNSKKYYEEHLKIKELNAYFRTNHHPVEIFVTPLGLDDLHRSSMERLDMDMLLLYTPYFFEEPIQELLYYLEQYEQQGGLVLGIMNLGYNQYGNSLGELQEYFGIQSKSSLNMFTRSNSSTRLAIVEEDEAFSKSFYTLQSRFYLSPGRSWKDAKLPETSIVALSDDQQIALTRYGMRYFYSGFISEQDIEQKDDALLFLSELLSIPLKDRMDLRICSVDASPLLGEGEHSPILRIQYENVGNLTANKLKLRVNQKQEFELPSLSPRSKESFTLPLLKDQEAGPQQLLLELQCLDQTPDQNMSNHRKQIACYIHSSLSNDPPELLLDGSLQRSTMEDMQIISGRVTIGSQLFINSQETAVHPDGTFTALLKLNKGRQIFELQAKNGNLESEPLQLEITRKDQAVLHLSINDPLSYYNYQASSLGEITPFIRNSISYVPLRYISESFGAEINYETELRKVIIQHKGLKIHMVIGEMQATVEGPEGKRIIALQGPSVIVLNRTFVPIRFIAETFGAKVDWEPILEMITITYDLDPLEVEAPLMEQKIDEKHNTAFSATVLDAQGHDRMIYANGMDLSEDGSLMISSHDGIYRWDLMDEPRKLIDFQKWSSDFPFNPELSQAKDQPHPTLFRVWKDKLIYSDQLNLYIVDPESGHLDYCIPAFEHSNYSYPLRQFDRIHDLQIEGDRAYILNFREGLSIIDLTQGRLVSRIEIPYYPVAFSIYEQMLTLVGFYGHMFRLDLSKGELQLFEPDIWFYAQSLFQDEQKLYIQMKDSFAIHEVTLRERKSYLGSGKKLASRSNYYLQQVFFLPRGIFGLIMDTDTGESFVSRLNSSFSVEKENLPETREWLKEHPLFLPFIQQCWLVEGNQVLLTQRYPADETVLKLCTLDGKSIKDIPIRLSSDEDQILGIQYLGDSTIAVLIADDAFTVQRIQFINPSRPQYSSTQLRGDPKTIQPAHFTADENNICIWDAKSGKNRVYDIASGKSLLQLDLASSRSGPRFFSEKLLLRYYQGSLYVLDMIWNLVSVFDNKGKLQVQWDLGMAFPESMLCISDMKVLETHKIALLDTQNARILFFDHGAVYYCQEDFKRPVSMDIVDKLLLVNDPGKLQLTLASLEDNRAKTPRLAVYPGDFSAQASYPYEWSDHMVIQHWDDDTPLHIEHPEGLYYESHIENKQYQVITWKLSGNEPLKQDITGKIIIRSENLQLEVPVNIKAVPVRIEIYSILIKKASAMIHPGLPCKIDQGMLYVELFTLEDILPVTCSDMNGNLMITMPQNTLIINTREGKASLMDQRGTRPFQLGAEVQMRKGKYLIPMNAIFRQLSIQTSVFYYPVTYEYPS